MSDGTDPWGTVYSEIGKASRKQLPPELMVILYDVLDTLTANPDAFPARVRTMGVDGKLRIYIHPSPPLEITYEVDPSRRVLHLWHFVAPRVQATKPVFISYSHKDAAWLKRLRQYLRPLEELDLIRIWDDTEIRVGSDWNAEIRKALDSARVAVFLVSQNLLDSPFVKETELPALLDAARNRGCLLFWIAVSSSTIEDSPLARYQGANAPSLPLDLMTVPEQNRELLEIYLKMKTAVSLQ
jgi:TIR domain-containing protein